MNTSDEVSSSKVDLYILRRPICMFIICVLFIICIWKLYTQIEKAIVRCSHKESGKDNVGRKSSETVYGSIHSPSVPSVSNTYPLETKMVCLYDSNHGKSTKGLEVIAAIKDAIMANCTDYIVEITEVHDIMHWQHDVFKPLILICPITNRLLHDTESALAKIRVEYYSSVALIVVHGKTKDYSRYGSSRSELSSKGNYGRLGEIIDWFMKNDSYNFEATRDIINFVTKMVK